ncbi:MAG TPA: acetylglutamate kinase [Vicinamibacterales bacterium]|nr:acetylglutamate kinase [Vicinamibacterales bacterium]
MTQPTVIKFGGELLDDTDRLTTVVSAVSAAARTGAPLIVVHGGGKEIDAALRRAGIEKRQVDGLRITDAATLDEVVAVLAGRVNTRFVGALATAGAAAVGLTGADGRCGLSVAAPPHRAVDGRLVDLGLVGVPVDRADVRLLSALLGAGFLPVIACIGIGDDGRLFNVNADTFAGHIAARIAASRLIVAGTTPGVLDDRGHTTTELDPDRVQQTIASGTATAGMVAKLRACVDALDAGVGDVVIVDGRDRSALESALNGLVPPAATRIVAALARPARS